MRELGEEIFGRSPLRWHSGGLVQMSLRQECRLGRESERTAADGLLFRSKILWRQLGGKGEAKRSAAVHLRVSQLCCFASTKEGNYSFATEGSVKSGCLRCHGALLFDFCPYLAGTTTCNELSALIWSLLFALNSQKD